MAPSNNRRSGFSRKAQYGLFASFVLAIAGAVFAGLLLIVSVVDPTGFAALRNVGTEISAPPARFFDSIRRSVHDIGDNTAAYLDAGSKNRALEKQITLNTSKLIEAKALKLENERLRKLVGLTSEEPSHIAIGRLISSSASSSRRLATLSIGTNYGLQKGQPVRGPEGLIGRIIETGPTTARILMITDANNPVPVMRVADGIPASGEGTSDGLVIIKPVNLGINPFKKGDIIVTSGNGGLFRPNIPYAIVIKVTTEGAIARPLCDPARTPYAMVLPIFEETAAAVNENPETAATFSKSKTAR